MDQNIPEVHVPFISFFYYFDMVSSTDQFNILRCHLHTSNLRYDITRTHCLIDILRYLTTNIFILVFVTTANVDLL